MLISRFITVACTLMFITGLAGCGQSPPAASESQPAASDGEKVIRDKIAAESEGRIKLASFQKTNGQAAERNGVPAYTLEYSGEIEFLEDCKWAVDNPYMRGFRTVKLKPRVSELDYDPNRFLPGMEVKQGQREKISGKIFFEKTENGWRGNASHIAPAAGSAG